MLNLAFSSCSPPFERRALRALPLRIGPCDARSARQRFKETLAGLDCFELQGFVVRL
ncbi:MAG TPA: hypothetical protein VF989_07730 [Polyangiaceae bacterium]